MTKLKLISSNAEPTSEVRGLCSPMVNRHTVYIERTRVVDFMVPEDYTM
jgi:hypothetical protein